MTDLGRAMRDAAALSTATRAPLAPGPVLDRIRRRRAAHVAAQSTVGVAAAGAIALGGLHLGGGREVDPVPPLNTSVPPSPTPTVTSSPTPLPATLPLECGSALADLWAPSDPVVAVQVDLDDTAVVPGDGLNATITASPVAGGPPAEEVIRGLDHVVVRDGMVVALTETWVDEDAIGMTAPEVTVRATVQLSPCDTSLPAGEAAALPLGEYSLYAVARHDVEGGPEAGADLLAGPWPFTVVAPAPQPAPAEPETPEPPPTAAPGPLPRPQLGDLIVSTSGLGPLTVGAPVEGNPGASMIRWDTAYCDGEADEDGGQWVPAGYGDDPTYYGDRKQPFFVGVREGTIGRIDVLGTSPRTATGVRIGSTLAELQQAYPQLQGPFEGPVSRVWWVSDASGSLVFETQGDADGLRPAGTPESVILMRVLAPGGDPAFATANSDDVAGGC